MRSALVIGSGPNGLAAAIHLAQHGYRVEVREAAATIGGGLASGALTLPGFVHDLGSAVHPMALCSPFFRSLPLPQHGLEWIFPPVPLAHPLPGRAVLLEPDLATTAAALGIDRDAYSSLYRPLVANWQSLMREVLYPLPALPRHPLLLARFGLRALQSASTLARSLFQTEEARALFAGLAAHSFLPLEQSLSAAFGLILGGAGHAVGWPIPKGGAQSIARALASCLRSLGGRIVVDSPVESLDGLGDFDLVMCDITPRQFLRMAGRRLPPRYAKTLNEYRYGPGVFKVDWALRDPIPWASGECRRAGTVHVGGTLAEIAASEQANGHATPSSRPFVLLAQPSLFDPSRAPDGRQTAWAYCHVPNGWNGSQLEAIEAQIERFAPGFRDVVLARATHSTAQMENWNANLIGGDINGGAADLPQFILRPSWRRYATPLKGVFLCSSSTPPGGGVHGMCGFHAARWAMNWMRRRVRISR